MLSINCQGENQTDLPQQVKDFYSQNKGKDFNIFRNWEISPRDEKDNAYICDYFENDEITSRYLVVDNGKVIFKKIFPIQDSIFQDLIDNDLMNPDQISLSLFKEFKSLKTNSLHFIHQYNLFIFKLDNCSILYSEEKIDDITNINRFSQYKSIDSKWFYTID